jgi:hypothetical protein
MTENDPLQPQADTPSATGPTVKLTNIEGGSSGPGQAGPARWSEVSKDWLEVGDEFKKLGARLSTAIRGSWKVGQEQELNGLQDQLRAMADQVEAAVRAARQEALSPETRAQTQRVVEAAKDAQATLFDEVRDTVAAGLRALNAQLRELAERIETGRK